MSGLEAVKKIVAPFLAHGICKDEAEALKMLAEDYVQRQVRRYEERAEHFRSLKPFSALPRRSRLSKSLEFSSSLS